LIVKRFSTIAFWLTAVLLAGAWTAAAAAQPAPGASGNGSSSAGWNAATLAQANLALQAGAADKALGLIESLPQAGAGDPVAQNLACRIQYALGRWDAAVSACEQAVRLDPGSSDNHMWLGRALGEKANQASFISAFSIGKRVLAEFQRATQLDPRNAEALSDLGEFYTEAPGVVGGGLDKAESVAKELDRLDPARAWQLRAGIARHNGDSAAAENYLKKAIAVSRHPALQWATLARFYASRSRWDEMETAIRNSQNAAAHDPHAAVALYDSAGVLIRVNRDPELAIRLLQAYLASPYKTEEAPAFVAYTRLARLQQQVGDTANAQTAQSAAYELAHEYRPAQDLRR
jgi:tetratricopeptide (TPR) repeat protein